MPHSSRLASRSALTSFDDPIEPAYRPLRGSKSARPEAIHAAYDVHYRASDRAIALVSVRGSFVRQDPGDRMSHWATRLRLVAGIVGLSLFAAAGQLHALSGGPTVPRSGAPGESNCASCHHGAENANGSVAVSFSGGNTYTPGVWKRVTITITPNPTTSAQVKYGFQASARPAVPERGPSGSSTITASSWP